MEEEKVKKLKDQFTRIYKDTVKHTEDIGKWIKKNNRNSGDIRRSLQRLKEKYNTLYLICDKAKEIGISEKELIPGDGISLAEIDRKIRQYTKTKIDPDTEVIIGSKAYSQLNNTKKDLQGKNARNSTKKLDPNTEIIIGSEAYTPLNNTKMDLFEKNKSDSRKKLDPNTEIIIGSEAYTSSNKTKMDLFEKNKSDSRKKLDPNTEIIIGSEAYTSSNKTKMDLLENKERNKKTKLDPNTVLIIGSKAYNQSDNTKNILHTENRTNLTEKLDSNTELVGEMPGTELYKGKKIITKKDNKKRDRFNIKNAFLSKFYDIKHKFQDRKMQTNKNNNKKVGRIAAAFMATVIGFFGGITVGHSGSKNQGINNEGKTNSYVDTNKNEFKKSLYIDSLEEETTNSRVQDINKKETIKEKKYQTDPPPHSQGITRFTQQNKKENTNETQNKESAKNVYIINGKTNYTEDSLGGGASGYVLQDTKAILYNSALVDTEKKEIVNVTNAGETLEESLRMDEKQFEEFLKANPNLKAMGSFDTEKGESLGWIEMDKVINVTKENGVKGER